MLNQLLKLLVEFLAMAVNGWVSPGGLDGQSSLTFFKAKKSTKRENKTATINSTKLPTIESEEDENWTNFARQSTCAAVMHLGSRSQPISVKIVWGIALIIGIFLTAVSTYYSTMDFMNLTGSSESVIQPNPPFQNEHPSYHICISNTFNLTILAELGFVDSDMISYLMVSFSLFVVSPFFLNNIEYQERLEAKFNDIMVNHDIKDVSEIVHKALLRCDEIIVGCIYYGINLDGVECCAKHFPKGSFLSPSGACVSTNGAPVINQVIPSSSFGFIAIVKDLSQSRASLDSSIINPISVNQKGVYFTVSDSATNSLIALFQQKQYTRFGLWTLIAMSKTIVNDEEKLSSVIVRKGCANRKEPDGYRHLVLSFQNYTEENCIYTLRQKTINQALGCFIVTFPYEGNLPPCRPFQLLKFGKKIAEQILSPNRTSKQKETECVSDCWKETYSISASYADLQITTNFTFGNWTISQDIIPQIAILNFYYPKFETTLLINHYPTISGWLGILGGNLGLFLGASMVTLIEVLVFCFGCCRSSNPY